MKSYFKWETCLVCLAAVTVKLNMLRVPYLVHDLVSSTLTINLTSFGWYSCKYVHRLTSVHILAHTKVSL